MALDDGRSLWVDSDERFFLIPDSVELPEGALGLVSLSGGRRKVDEAAIAEYEIPKEEAFGRIGNKITDVIRLLPQQLEAAVTSRVVEQLLRDTATRLQELADRLRVRGERDKS